MSRPQPQQPQPQNSKNAWAQGSGWDRVAADAPMKGRDKPQKSAAVPPNSDASTTNDRNRSKAKNHKNSSISNNGSKTGVDQSKNNTQTTTINNSNRKKQKIAKPSFSASNSNSNKIVKKKQKRSANEPESQPKPKQQPFILLKPTDFPALQTPVNAPPPAYTKPIATKLDASAPSFPPVSSIPASNNSTTVNTTTAIKSVKPSKNSSDPTQTKVPTPQKQTSSSNASTIAARTPNQKNSTTNNNTHDLPQGQEHALLRLMQQGKMGVVQKGRQRIRPRRKKFSALKKKVLEERLRQWREQSNNSSKDDHPNQSTSTLLAVLGWLTADDDWSDDDEYHELCSNIQEMAEKMGPVQRVWIPRRDDGPIYVQFQTPQAADDALHAWMGLSLGGTALEVMALSLTNEDDDKDMSAGSDEEEIWRARCEQAFQEKQSLAMQIDTVHEIGLWNALTEDDLEDEECLEESVNDIRVLAVSYGSLETLCVEREGAPRVVLVYTCNPQDAKRIAGQLNQVTLSGTQLLAKVLRNDESCSEPGSDFIVVLRNVLTTEDVEDEECLEESMEDVKELAKQFGIVEKVDANVKAQTISVHYTSAEEKERALVGFHGMIIGGQTVSATTVSGSDEAAFDSGKKNNDDEAIETMFSGDKRIPERFAECKRVPKVPNSGQPRHYSVLSENETVKPLLMEMLAELMRLQKRAVEDKNAKAKRRLVMGLREVARGIRAHKVRMVVMANNLDEYGALDEKLQEILDLARREEVPVFFEFSKRALGKAIGKTIKVAVIGIQNPDGANQQFKKLSGLAVPIPVHQP